MLEEVRKAELGLTAPGERGLAHEALVEHAAKCVDIARACGFLTLDQLRSDVLQRADELTIARQLSRIRTAGQAEVGEGGDAVVVEQHVRRLHVAMDDRAGMQRIETLPELRREVDRRVERESPLRSESIAQRATAEVGHHDVPVADLEHGHEMTGLACGREPRLAGEPLLGSRIFGPQNLHGDLPPAVGRAVDDARRPLPEDGPEAIAANPIHAVIISAR